MQKIIKKYNQWVKNSFIYKSWQSEDYEDTIVYESINGDIITLQRDTEGKIIAAYEE